MHITNVRCGFACNSSSSHSIILVPPSQHLSDDHSGFEFGWDNFTLVSPEAKLSYLAVLLYQNLTGSLNEDLARHVVKGLTGISLSEDAYIDHQSMLTLPQSFDRKGVHPEFVADLKKYLLRPEVVILGGNDNSDGHPLCDSGQRVDLHLPQEYRCEPVARKDGQTWTLFSVDTGTKVRFSFVDANDVPTRPELVDVKITDYCPFGCAYCYQNSTPKGEHAEESVLGGLAWALGNMQVFECAIGGGEPTLHPHFAEFVESLRAHGVVPNFTTRNIQWFRQPEADKIMPLIGSVAVSVSTTEEAKQALSSAHHAGFISKLTLQVIDKVVYEHTLRSILTLAREYTVPVTLLGYKESGRGKTGYRTKTNWVQVVRSMKGGMPRLGVDTAIVREYGDALKELEIPRLLYDDREGVHSMYIDAVEETASAASYGDLPTHSLNGMYADSLAEAYHKLRSTQEAL